MQADAHKRSSIHECFGKLKLLVKNKKVTTDMPMQFMQYPLHFKDFCLGCEEISFPRFHSTPKSFMGN